jgi:hypothetical protein
LALGQDKAAKLMSWKREGIVSSNVALRPPVTPNIDCPIVHHLPLHCIAAAEYSHHRIHLAASPHRRQPCRRPLPSAAEFRAGPVSISSPPCNAHARSKKPIHVLPATTPCSAITTQPFSFHPPHRWPPALASATQHVRRPESLAIARRSTHRQPGR